MVPQGKVELWVLWDEKCTRDIYENNIYLEDMDQ